MMDITKPAYIEAAIYMVAQGEHAGKYMATCAMNECGYTGESRYNVCIEAGPHSSP
jgi:hypothetical protein